MKKLIYVLVGVVCALPAMEIEMKVRKRKIDYRNASPELLAAVLTVPAISKMLAKHYVSCPIDIAKVSFEDARIEVTNLQDNETRFPLQSINYFQCTSSEGQAVDGAELSNFVYQSKAHHDGPIASNQFLLDGPNKNGIFLTNSTFLERHAVRMVTNENNINSLPNRAISLNTWSIALSENNVAAFSSLSTKTPHAILEFFTCNQCAYKVDKTDKSSKPETILTLTPKKSYRLSCTAFHVFRKMSFLSEDLILGLDQSGQLYIIEHYLEDKKRPPVFHHLSSKNLQDFGLSHYALDSYDKHTILMVDNYNDVRLAKITANKLITKKIRSLQDIRNAIQKSGNVAKSLLSMRMAGNVCYFTFEGQTDKQQISVTFNILPLQLSPQQKLNRIKAKMGLTVE
ncbi:hypothetical protein Noda2021_03630 [Candidatus Dependentiae bacterium Noda2021]|nr:hypothetical protein Noda2021_03630 [Candidatus Dependentiae bacterium Noda2021]